MFEPERFGRYLLIRKLATGGMAELFLAKLLGAEGFEKEVVIKKILPQWSSDRDFILMLIDEAKIAVQLNHPNIVPVYELAREGEAYYIAMEYLNGVDLRRLMQKAGVKKKKIPLDISLSIMIEVLEGLAYAHSKKDSQGRPLQIIHRDISPQNILVSFEGNVKITDFGIAKAASRSHETMIGVLKGKFAYMSPEQANQEELDHRSDLFSAAVVLYELLTGERLFYRGQDIDTLDRVRRGQVNFSEAAERLIPPPLKEILIRALAKERGGRFADTNAFREEIVRFARRTKKTLRRDKVAQFLLGLFADEIQDLSPERQTALTQKTTFLVEETRTLERGEVFARADATVFEKIEPPRVIPSPVRPLFPRVMPREIKGLPLYAGGFLIFVAIGLIFFFFFLKGEPRSPTRTPKVVAIPPPSEGKNPVPPEVVQPITERQVIAVDTEPLPPIVPTVKPTPVKEIKKKLVVPDKDRSVKSAFLSVQAIPWGYVTIDGGSRRMETPVTRLPLKPGRHRIEILYEPEGTVVSSQIKMDLAEEVICVANFRGEKGIRCGR